MAESLQFSIGADTKSFTDGIDGMIGKLAGLAAAFVSIQAIVNAFSDAIELGGRLNDLSTRTGETAGNLAILERAFENTNVSAEKLGPAIAKMQVNMVEMQKGSDAAVAAFKQLGLSWDDLEGKSPTDQMQLIGERLAAIEDPALRASTAVKIFGKSGSELLPILVNFSSETEEAKRQLGSLPDQLNNSAFAVDSLGDNLSAIGNKLTELAYGFLSEVIPAIEAFTGKLSGIDAASIGAGLADVLVGAFAAPMKAAELLGDTLILGVKLMGNELVYQVRSWTEILFNTFSALSDNIIPMLGNNMVGAFEMAAGALGYELTNAIAAALGALEPVAGMLGFGGELDSAITSLGTLAQESQTLMENGAARIAESANMFQGAFAEAQKNSTVVREDFFNAQGSSQKIKDDFAAVQKSAQEAVDSLTMPAISSSLLAEGRTMTESGKNPLISILENEALVNQKAEAEASKSKGPTAAQIQAELNRQLTIIGGASATQAIGQSVSARKAIDLQKELDRMQALGIDTPGEMAKAAAISRSLATNLDAAFGNVITSADRDRAHQLAVDDYFKGSTQSISDLERQYEKQILEEKRAGDPLAVKEQMEKAKEAGAGGKPPAEKPVTLQSIVNSVLQILQKIEPKIPQHIMS